MFEAENRAGFGDGVEPLEYALLEVHVLEHRLDHEVGLNERAEVERRRELAHPLFDVGHGQAAFLGGVLVVAAHDRYAAIERLFRRLHNRDRNPGGKKIHRNAAAHGAGADHPDASDRFCRHVRTDVGDLGGLPLGEEDMPLRLGLRCRQQRHEHLAFFEHALVERQIDGVPDRLDCLLPRLESPEFPGVGLADRLEDFRMAAGRLELVRAVAHLFQRRLFGDETARVGERRFVQLAFLGKLVDDAQFLGFARAERRSRENDVERLLDPDETRQALRAAGARDEAELDLGQAAFGGRHGDPVMRGQRHLESSAERGSVQRGDDRLRRVLDPIEHVRKVRRGGGLAEFGDVGAGDEGSPCADDHDRLDGAVRFGRLDPLLEAVAHGLRQRVDRRRVDRDRRDVSVDREFGDGIDGGHGFPPCVGETTTRYYGQTARRFSALQRQRHS